MKIAAIVGTVILSSAVSAMSATVPTTHYDADDNVLPNAAGQVFQGGTLSDPQSKISLVDLGGGDRALEFNTYDANVNAGAFFSKTAAQSPSTWAVDPTIGYSVEFSLRFDLAAATENGAADFTFGSANRAPTIRFTKAVGAENATASIVSASATGTSLGNSTVSGAATGFHTYRLDVLNDNVRLYIDGVLLIDATDSANYTSLNAIRIGDLTGAGDGKYQIQYLDTYQNGVVPEPAALSLLVPAAATVFARRRR